MQPTPWVKICGLTRSDDVEVAIASGADAIGLNFVSWSKRRIDVDHAKRLVDVARKRIEVIGVVCDLTEDSARELAQVVGLNRLQLHGSESDELLLRLGSLAFKAVGVKDPNDVVRAAGLPGELLLVDADSGQRSGGAGVTFDWGLVAELTRSRRVVVAGGLHPGNVADAVRVLAPYGVDVASGVEPKGSPGIKDPILVQRFVREARRAADITSG